MKTNKRKAKGSGKIYSLITLAAFILGIVFVSKDPKEKLRTLSGGDEVKYVEDLERKKIQKRRMELAVKARKGKLKPYLGPGVLVVPPKKNEPLTVSVCRGLFNISTVLEGYGDIDRNAIQLALTVNSKPVIQFFDKYRDPNIESVLNDIGDLEDILMSSENDANLYFDYTDIKERLLSRIHTFLELSCEKMKGEPNPFDVFV